MRRITIGLMAALLITGLGWWLASERDPMPQGPLVLAAASMQSALDEVAAIWTAQGHPPPVLSYAASSAIARQAMAGARADLLITADRDWMDRAEAAGVVIEGSRADLVANRIVLVAPRGSTIALDLVPGAPLASALGEGRLAMADPDAVPAGRYGKAALTRLNLWQAVELRVARAENVRAALALVERGAAPLGVVYATDAAQSDAVRVVATFDASLHPPIRYPVALLTAGEREGAAFRKFLTEPQAQAVFARHGFARP
ncbi:molybdate ABC transporter substrate-binding protein [Sphingomonas sp. AX6]|uniref:molybdate ABC transporter substrate-binding protein n=1 Tax=Sphingomonas sp. AX6 TaxID=2653171 RepID=UPI0012F24344|nr:molybdate ABC transporter substrate-binding protein [Sphingomonas sp. AX6]VXC87438.1 molybdate transporter subunit; periplasmic-binding component of ABC superfamily [Sphingomonas sp. AX6]